MRFGIVSDSVSKRCSITSINILVIKHKINKVYLNRNEKKVLNLNRNEKKVLNLNSAL